MEEIKELPNQEATHETEEMEPIHICDERGKREKKQHADDVALTQCILCILLVLAMFVLHWLRPEWQTMLLSQYTAYRDAPPVAWLDSILQAIQDWMKG